MAVYGELKVIYLVTLGLCRFSLGIHGVSRVRRRRLPSGHGDGLAAGIGGNGGVVEPTAAADCFLGRKLERIARAQAGPAGRPCQLPPSKSSLTCC
jgi:hypothetical protein